MDKREAFVLLVLPLLENSYLQYARNKFISMNACELNLMGWVSPDDDREFKG